MNEPEFDSVAAVFKSSHLYGAWRSLTEGFAAASGDSALLRPVRSFASTFAQQPASRKVAFSATAMGVAALAHLAIRMTLPHYTTSGLPWWWNVTEAVLAFGIALESDALTRAWIDSTPARIWRRLTT